MLSDFFSSLSASKYRWDFTSFCIWYSVLTTSGVIPGLTCNVAFKNSLCFSFSSVCLSLSSSLTCLQFCSKFSIFARQNSFKSCTTLSNCSCSANTSCLCRSFVSLICFFWMMEACFSSSSLTLPAADSISAYPRISCDLQVPVFSDWGPRAAAALPQVTWLLVVWLGDPSSLLASS